MNSTFSLPVILLLIILLAVFSFFFSAAETAVIGLSKIRLRHMIAKGIKRAQGIQRLLKKIDKFIAAILIGNDFVNIAISAIIAGIAVELLGYRWGVIIATFVSSFFVLIACEITPKMLATRHPERVALFTAPLMEFFIKLFRPVIFIFTSISNLILKAAGVKPGKRIPVITEEELRMMIEISREEGVVTDEERRMLQRIFEFADKRIDQVMMPREKVVAVNADVTSEQLLDIFIEEGHARLPVYKDTTDNIIGIIYARDLLYILKDKRLFLLPDLIREAYYAPSSMRVNELLKKFQADNIHMAIVLDENKKAVGLVTLEDLIEEIVGDLDEKRAVRIKK
ncbi:MAG: HlyC/CorC family transporter [Candidatus Omnitrophica bacterium]|nr:HlyC/CorC family transporter [Candidatus Omnitrophota bacterium]